MKIIGHRGAKDLAPENTLASFQKAIDVGVDEIECDVRVTKDGVIIMEHELDMRDAAGRKYRVPKHTYAELKEVKPDLTTMEAALALVNHQVPVMIEIKPKVPVEPILDHIASLHRQGWKTTDLSIASESYRILKAVHQRMPELTLSLVESWSGVRATLIARHLGITRLSMNYKVLWSGFLRPMSKRGYQISAYTVNDPRVAERLERSGAHGIFTDKPDLFR